MLKRKSCLDIPKARTRAVISPTDEFYAGSLKGRADEPEIGWSGPFKASFGFNAFDGANTYI